MDLFASIDLYCERTGEGLLSEPLNLLSNLAFIISGYLIIRKLNVATPHQNASSARVLAWIIMSVGVGSGLFHSFANMWSQLCEVIPIGVLIITYLWLFLRNIGGLDKSAAAGTLITFLLFSAGCAAMADPSKANGGQFYFGTWIMLLCLCWFLFGRGYSKALRPMVAASLLFLLSIILRTLDLIICDHWPIGTHVFWHLLNAWVLYLVVQAYIISTTLQQSSTHPKSQLSIKPAG